MRFLPGVGGHATARLLKKLHDDCKYESSCQVELASASDLAQRVAVERILQQHPQMTGTDNDADQVQAPLEKPALALTEPFRAFITAQTASSWALLAMTALAVLAANSALAPHYLDLLHTELRLQLGEAAIVMSLQHWVNDGLMSLFFFLLGLELKRELMVGRLGDRKRAASVMCAAGGGMVAPAIIFLLVADDPTVRSGWAIPVATDTAFAIMLLVLLGDRVPGAARPFLVGLAIVDDLGAIMVIAIGYTSAFNLELLWPVAGVIAVLAILNLVGMRHGLPYFLCGVTLWLLLLQLGVHGTLAGVVVAFAAPVRPAIARGRFMAQVRRQLRRFEDEHDRATSSIMEQPEQQAIAEAVSTVAARATAPLRRWESRLELPISFGIVPLFAFMNAGVVLSAEALATTWDHELGTAIVLALLVGKPVGITAGIGVGQLAGIARLPRGLSWRHIVGLGLLGGVGFTMSLYIATLGFGDGSPLLEISKLNVIAASACAGVLGYAWLRLAGGKARQGATC